MAKEIGVVRDVRVGVRDVGRPCIWFEVKLASGGGFLHIAEWPEAEKLVQESDSYDIIKAWEGRTIWVETEGLGQTCKLLGWTNL